VNLGGSRCLELDPKYVDVVVARWQGLSGKKATLEARTLSVCP
jgi:hypothetical protein